jgi:hypothetical protein
VLLKKTSLGFDNEGVLKPAAVTYAGTSNSTCGENNYFQTYKI